MSKIFFVCALILGSLLSTEAFPQSDTPTSPEAVCKQKGGKWEGSINGRGRLSGCNMPTSDGGKTCSRGEDCQSVCLENLKCSAWKMFKGCGFFKGQPQLMCVE